MLQICKSGVLHYCLPFLCFLSCTYFLDETFGSSPSVDDVEYITDVHTDATGQILCESNVATQGIPVAVESQSDKFAFAVEHRATGISAGDVIVRQETELHFAAFLVFVRAEVAFFKQDLYFRFHLIFVDFVALCDFIQQARLV